MLLVEHVGNRNNYDSKQLVIEGSKPTGILSVFQNFLTLDAGINKEDEGFAGLQKP